MKRGSKKKYITRTQAAQIIREFRSARNEMKSWTRWRKEVSNFMSRHRNYWKNRSKTVQRNQKLRYAQLSHMSKLVDAICKSIGNKVIFSARKPRSHMRFFTPNEIIKINRLIKQDYRPLPKVPKGKLTVHLTPVEHHKLMKILKRKDYGKSMY